MYKLPMSSLFCRFCMLDAYYSGKACCFSICRANSTQYWSFFIFFLIGTTHGQSQTGMRESGSPATHFNFMRSALRGRRRVLWCANDPGVCLNREKNPWGGSTCCHQKFCKDIMSDPNNCGKCGQVCTFGLICCDGKCVDVQNDPRHCGACFDECAGENKCYYAMCNYGG